MTAHDSVLRVGDRVVVEAGGLSGQEGVIDKRSGRSQFRVALDVHPADLPGDQLWYHVAELAKKPRGSAPDG